jgi:hypothetical protein
VKQCSVSATSEERKGDQGQRPLPKVIKMQQIAPIKISNKGEKYYINRAVDTTNKNQIINEEQNCSDAEEMEVETSQRKDERNTTNDGLTHQEESWKEVTSSKKRKIAPNTNARRVPETENQQWLQDITLRNSFSALPEEKETDTAEIQKTRIAKPPPIFVDAQIIDPLIELPNNTAGNEMYTIKQLKLDQVKVQTNTPEAFRKVTKALKDKNAGYHTYQLTEDTRRSSEGYTQRQIQTKYARN